jgi:hypothetical protein
MGSHTILKIMANKIDEGKILSFLFDKVEAGDDFEKIKNILRTNNFSEDEINYTQSNFSSILERCVEYHDIVKEEISKATTKAEKAASASLGFDVVSGFIYILIGMGLLGYFSGRLMEETMFFSIGLIAFGGYKIYSGLHTK